MPCIYREPSSSPQLAGYIRYFFIFEPDAKAVERVTPNGTVQISFQVNPNLGKGERLYILSRFSKTRYVVPTDLGRVIGICFYPWAVRTFLKVPPYELTDKKISLEDIFGTRIISFYEEILNSADHKEAFKIIENYLIKVLHDSHPIDRMVEDASKRILKSYGTVQLNSLVSAYNISERRFEQRFNESLGVTPKFYSRLARFQNSLRLLNSGINLTEITYQCGYFDQSHFIRDFKLFSGITPNKYLAEKHSVDDICATAPPIV